MSERSSIAVRIAQAAGLEKRFTPARVRRMPDGSYYAVTFTRPGKLEAEVRVYSAKWFLVKWTTSIRWLPPVGLENLYSEAQVVRSLRGFVEDLTEPPLTRRP